MTSNHAAESPPHGRSGEEVANRFREDILAGVFAPGTRITQIDLAERYDSTRAPVREAIRILGAEGLVSSVANTGAWIASLGLHECHELYRLREQLEPMLIGDSARGLSPADHERLAGLAEEMAATADTERFLALDREFHFLAYSRADTIMLADQVRGLWNRTQHYRRAFVSVVRTQGDPSADYDHALIARALARGDAEEASAVLRLHIRRTRIRLADHPEIFE
ncbi:GntR family transcriptional regulator [Gulosibacter sp. 10]|uniref:GntR family transcriptional regulator n=1 Tax=Gulosibacter sp. 10 TaxID=1255570 RepID=UPI00097F567B|nr:GntR family transcriptional regulator [Gulosibacter sp. 10]SJM63879.1 Transcriptional regulator, GntR family [Gulosibacter sp. 10]